jgi:predicted DNA-binding ribbon-helix-helix protein
MINFNEEYFSKPYYFYLKDRGDKVSLYYSVSETLSESRKQDKKMDFDKKDSPKIKNLIGKIMKNKSVKSTDEVTKSLKNIKPAELEELVDNDGTMSTSRIPILNRWLTPRRTMDQTIVATRQTNNPITRGYRTYYGESVGEEPTVNEVDYSDAFGYEETKDMDGKDTFQALVKSLGMETDEAKKRTNQFGKDPSGKRDNKSKYKNDKNFIAMMTISEREKMEMSKMVDEMLSKRSKDNSEVQNKETTVSKMLKKNIQAIKKIADNEGISINQLIKILKSE